MSGKKMILHQQSEKTHCECGEAITNRVCLKCGMVHIENQITNDYYHNSRFDHHDLAIYEPINSAGTIINFKDFRYRNSKISQLLYKYKYLNGWCESGNKSKINKAEKEFTLFLSFYQLQNQQNLFTNMIYLFRRFLNHTKHSSLNLMASCIYISLKTYHINLSIGEIVEYFRNLYHRVSRKYILCVISETGMNKLLKFSNYKERVLSASRKLLMQLNENMIIARINKKKLDIDYCEYLKNAKIFIETNLDKFINANKTYSGSPISLAAAIIYTYFKNYPEDNKAFVTQIMLSDMWNIPEYTIRDIYVKYFKHRVERIES